MVSILLSIFFYLSLTNNALYEYCFLLLARFKEENNLLQEKKNAPINNITSGIPIIARNEMLISRK